MRSSCAATVPRSARTPAPSTGTRSRAHRAACAARAAVPIRDLLDTLLRSFGRHYTRAKRDVSGVDFEDLELLSLELLRSTPELRERYAERFARIMVDEQQDTNRVQLELIEAIARQNLFTVGDAQQSIYRFRHADVALFEAPRASGSGPLAGALTLATNFRSRPEILAALNAAFADRDGRAIHPAGAGPPAGVLRPRRRVRDAPQTRPGIRGSSCCWSTRAPSGSSRAWPRRGVWVRPAPWPAGWPSWWRRERRPARSSSSPGPRPTCGPTSARSSAAACPPT